MGHGVGGQLRTLKNKMLVPPRLYKLFDSIDSVHPDIYIPAGKILVIDDEGHVHALHYEGRLIDQPLTVSLGELEGEETL